MNNLFVNKLFSLWKGFCRLALAFVLTIILVRAFETLILWKYGIEISNLLGFNIIGFLLDTVLYFKVLPVLFVIYALTGWFKEKASRLIINILHIILSVVSVALIIYFCSAKMPLDKVFVYYSGKELLHIIGASETTYIWAYLCLALIPLAYLILTKIIKRVPDTLAIVVLVLFVASCFISTPVEEHYSNRNEFFIKKNKIEYFFDSFENNISVSGIQDLIEEEKIMYEIYPDYDFVDFKYPLLYKDNAQDVLSPYFELGTKLPNIVVFIVEGLARENSGHNSKFVSATPYLDSLSDHALCWDNCYSTSPRTCHVLPSLLGSLPYGKSGFMSYVNNVPEFQSLPKILKDNGYRFAYFYGGWLGFDETESFLRNNGVDCVLNPELYKTHKRRNTWGLLDDALIDEAMKTMKTADQPRLDVFMTLTTHDPWDYPNAETYQNEYISFDTTVKKHNPYINKTAAYLYADDCIKKVIEEYSKRDGFENTIFVFTGDHNYDESDYMGRYKVPLVIWSPMLKKTAVFKPVVTHRDFTPSILAMLKKHYGIVTPNEVTWLSRGLDTVREFRANAVAPHITYSRNICGMFCGNHLVQDKNVYRLEYQNDDVRLVKDNDADSLVKYLNAYKALDRYVFENDALVRNDYNTFTMRMLSNKVYDNGIPLVSYAERDSVFKCGTDDFPFVVMEVPLDEAYKFIKVDLSFDIFMVRDKVKEYSAVRVLISRKTPSGEIIPMCCEFVDLYMVWGYYKWQNWRIDEVLKYDKYKYEAGDTLLVRFWNYDNLPFYLSNVKASLSVGN